MLENQKIFFQKEKALKNRIIDITCRGILIQDTSILDKYYQKDTIIKACKEGCPNYGKKWSCPPLSKNYYELLNGYNRAVLICISTRMNNYMDIKNKYIAIKAANVTLKNLVERIARKVEIETDGYALLSGSCRLCRLCACKSGQKCKHPDKMRYSIEASYLDVQAICEELMDFKLLWYEKKALPEYTSTVSIVFLNDKVNIELISKIIQKEVIDY